MTTTHYVVTIELDHKDAPTPDQVDHLIEQLQDIHPTIFQSPRGWLGVTVTLPGETLRQAVLAADALITAAACVPAIAWTAMSETERDAREGWEPLPEFVTVTQAAETLGVSRQAVLDRINRHTLPATKIGRDYAIPATVLGAGATGKIG